MAIPINRWLAALRGRLAPAPAPEVAVESEDDADEPMPATREEEIRGALKWFNRFQGPPAELVAWFAAHETSDTDQETHAYDLRGAIEKRRWILRGTAQNEDDQHFDGRSNWLPLIASGRDILIYESGPRGNGVVRRRADRRDLYARDRAHPVPLARFTTSLLQAVDAGPAVDRPEPPLEQVLKLLGVPLLDRSWDPRASLPFFTAGPPRALIDWFSLHDGAAWFPSDVVRSKWRALSLEEAVVLRDQLLELGSPALVTRLQEDPRWLPLLLVDDLHVLLYSEERGVAFYQRVDGHFDIVPWSRWSTLDSFIAASLVLLQRRPVEPVSIPLTADYFATRLIEELQELTSELEVERVLSAELAIVDPASLGVSGPFLRGLLAWFEANAGEPGPPLVAGGEKIISAMEAVSMRQELGRPSFPLVLGSDGISTAWVEGVGVAHVTLSGALIPIASTFVGWLDALCFAASSELHARNEPGSISRNMLGVWTVDTAPLVAKDLIAALHALPWKFSRSFYELELERGDETEVSFAVHSKMVVRLAPALIDRMIADLEALDGYDPISMQWEDIHDLVLIVRPKR